jgi:hypothetical protein
MTVPFASFCYVCLTNFRLKYETDDLSGTPSYIYRDGDGTNNERSLKGCLYWRNKQRQRIDIFEIPKAEHREILRNEQALAYIVDVLVNKN